MWPGIWQSRGGGGAVHFAVLVLEHRTKLWRWCSDSRDSSRVLYTGVQGLTSVQKAWTYTKTVAITAMSAGSMERGTLSHKVYSREGRQWQRVPLGFFCVTPVGTTSCPGGVSDQTRNQRPELLMTPAGPKLIKGSAIIPFLGQSNLARQHL